LHVSFRYRTSMSDLRILVTSGFVPRGCRRMRRWLRSRSDQCPTTVAGWLGCVSLDFWPSLSIEPEQGITGARGPLDGSRLARWEDFRGVGPDALPAPLCGGVVHSRSWRCEGRAPVSEWRSTCRATSSVG